MMQTEFPDMPEKPPPPPPEPFMIDGRVQCRISIAIDLAALIRDYPDTYAMVDMGGYAEWERPIVFLYDYLAQDYSGILFSNRVTEHWNDFEFDEDRHWNVDQYQALVAICPEAVPLNEEDQEEPLDRS